MCAKASWAPPLKGSTSSFQSRPIIFNRIVIYLPYTFPFIILLLKYWLIPNCTWIIAWGVVHICTLISSIACRLIHNDRVVGKVYQSWQGPLLSFLSTKGRLAPSYCTFLPLFSPTSVLEHRAPSVAMVLITICEGTWTTWLIGNRTHSHPIREYTQS